MPITKRCCNRRSTRAKQCTFALILPNKPVEIRCHGAGDTGEFAAPNCTLNGKNKRRLFKGVGASLKIVDVKVMEGNATSSYGGAFQMINSVLEIVRCNVLHNSATVSLAIRNADFHQVALFGMRSCTHTPTLHCQRHSTVVAYI